MSDIQDPMEGGAAHEVHLRDYWKVLLQGRYTFLAIFLVILAATAVFTFTRTPIYRSTATVLIESRSRSVTPGQDMSGMGAGGYGWWAEEKYQNTQMEIVNSRDVARRAFESLALASDPYFAEATDPIEAFRGLIQVDQRRKTGLLEISLQGADPEEITRWVNAVADSYVQRNVDKAQQNIRVAVDTIRSEIEIIQGELGVAEETVVSTLNQEDIFDPDAERENLRGRISNYDEQLTEASIEKARLRGRLERIQQLQVDGGDPMNLTELASNNQIEVLNREIRELERKIDEAKVTLRAGHPEYESLQSQVNRARQNLRDQVSLVLANVRDDYSAAEDKTAQLTLQKDTAEKDLFRVNQATARVNLVKTDAETKRQIFDLLTRSMNEVELTAGLMSNNITVLDRATPPLYAIKPVKRVNLAIGGMLGIFLGLAVVFFLDYLDNTIRNPQDIEENLQLSVLGVIPKITDEGNTGRAVQEAYQSLRTSIIFSSKNRRRKVLLITSTGPQEGKSSTIANLARVLAAAGDRVLVLDCDLRRPTQHVQHDTGRDSGLTNYLAAPEGEDDWRPFTQTLGDGLDLMPCGPIPPSPPELLGSDRFSELIARVRDHYDWVLIDSPPSASLADSTLLAAISDMVILIVKHNHADKDVVRRNVSHLRSRNAPLVGAVLNNVDIDKLANKDYYYAGYYYLSEDGTKKKSKKRPVARAKVG
jgi:capsular exopolysaccharide synthesis family protein